MLTDNDDMKKKNNQKCKNLSSSLNIIFHLLKRLLRCLNCRKKKTESENLRNEEINKSS